MRRTLVFVGLLAAAACPVGAQSVQPAPAPGGELGAPPDPGRSAQQARREERKAALREALKHRREMPDDDGAGAPRRALNPEERAQLRQQLRQQSFGGRHRP